jgi:hypothetical protein
MKKVKDDNGDVFVETSNGHRIPKDLYLQVKEEFKQVLIDQDFTSSKEVVSAVKKKLLDSGEVVDPSSISPYEGTEKSSLTVIEGGKDFIEHMKAEVSAANEKYEVGQGGGVFLSSDHVEFQNTANGAVFVFPDKVVDMASGLKTALRTAEPLENKVVSMSMVILANIKDNVPGGDQ